MCRTCCKPISLFLCSLQLLVCMLVGSMRELKRNLPLTIDLNDRHHSRDQPSQRWNNGENECRKTQTTNTTARQQLAQETFWQYGKHRRKRSMLSTKNRMLLKVAKQIRFSLIVNARCRCVFETNEREIDAQESEHPTAYNRFKVTLNLLAKQQRDGKRPSFTCIACRSTVQ